MMMMIMMMRESKIDWPSKVELFTKELALSSFVAVATDNKDNKDKIDADDCIE